MHTKITPAIPTIDDLQRILSGPLEVRIDGAAAYWIGQPGGTPLGPESDRTLDPCALVLRLMADGVDPDDLMLWARLENGELYDVGGGVSLVGMAQGTFGIPARPRIPANKRTVP